MSGHRCGETSSSWQPRRGARLALLVLPLALTGCYAGLVGAILGASSGDSGGGGANAQPEVQVLEVSFKDNVLLSNVNWYSSGCRPPADPLGPCLDQDDPRSLYETEIVKAASLDRFTSGEIEIGFKLFGASAPVTVRLYSEAGEVPLDGVVLDGSPSPPRTRPLSTGTDHTISLDLSRFGRTSVASMAVAIKPRGGKEVREAFAVDNRPPIAVRLCSFQPGFACTQRPELERKGRCTFFVPSVPNLPASNVQLILLYLESPASSEPCSSVGTHVIPLQPRPLAAGSGDCPANYEADFDLPEILDCKSTGVVVALAEVSGNLDPHLPVAAGVHISETIQRINSSAPELRGIEIRSFQPGARRHSGDLFGLVVIDYTVSDPGEEPFDLDISVDVPGVKSLRLSDGSLTEARGVPCEGSLGRPSDGRSCLPTSREGISYRFIWNSDFDIDRLVGDGPDRLQEPRVPPGIVFTVTLTDEDSGISTVNELEPEVLDNTTLHTVAGLQPGRTSLDRFSVEESQATFETISGIAIDDRDPADPVFYFVDSGTHILWSTRPLSLPGEILREAGTGSIRIEEEARDFDEEIARKTILRQPMDVIAGPDGAVYLLEGGDALWKLENGVLELLLGEEALRAPEQMALDEANQVLYIADTRNCRIIKFPLGNAGEGPSVIAGDLRELDLKGENGYFRRLFAQKPEVLEQRNVTGCTFRDVLLAENVVFDEGLLPPEPPDEMKLHFPGGIGVLTSQSGPVLLVSDTDDDRLVSLDAAVPDPGSTLVPLLTQIVPDDPMTPADEGLRLCSPSRITVAPSDGGAPRLFLTVKDLIDTSPGGTKGVVAVMDIEDRPGGHPLLSQPRPFAGIDDFSRVTCGNPTATSNYDSAQECLPAAEAPLSLPTEIAMDAARNAYLCDSRNQQLRKIGNGGSSCVPAPPSTNPAVLSGAGLISKLLGASVEGLSPCEVIPEEPGDYSICLPDSRPFSAFGEKMREPVGLHFLDDATLLIGDRSNNRIRRLDLRAGVMTTIAGRARTADEIQRGITFSGDGDHALKALLSSVRSVAAFPRQGFCSSAERKLFVADYGNHRIRMIDSNDAIWTVIGMSGDFPPLPGGAVEGEAENLELEGGMDPLRVILKFPKHVLLDSRGRLFVSDSARHRILKLEGGMAFRVVGVGSGFRDRNAPAEAPIPDPDSMDPIAVGDGMPALQASLHEPNEMVFDRREEFLYFCDGRNFRVRRVRYDVASGTFPDTALVETVAGNGSDSPPGPQLPERALDLPIGFPYGLAFSPDEKFLYCTETFGRSRIYRVDLQPDPRDNKVCRIAGAVTLGSAGDGDDAVNAQFNNPTSLQVDAAGNIYVADGRNHRIRKFFPVPSRCSSESR